MAITENREFRLGKERKEVRARGAEPDFDHPVGHGHDLANRSERIAQRIAA